MEKIPLNGLDARTMVGKCTEMMTFWEELTCCRLRHVRA